MLQEHRDLPTLTHPSPLHRPVGSLVLAHPASSSPQNSLAKRCQGLRSVPPGCWVSGFALSSLFFFPPMLNTLLWFAMQKVSKQYPEISLPPCLQPPGPWEKQ